MAKIDLEKLQKINELHKLIETTYDVENLFVNLKSKSENDDSIRLTTSKFSKFGECLEIINSEAIPDELIKRLLDCCKVYKKELEEKFYLIEIDGI